MTKVLLSLRINGLIFVLKSSTEHNIDCTTAFNITGYWFQY